MTHEELVTKIVEGLQKVMPKNIKDEKMLLLVASIIDTKIKSFEQGYMYGCVGKPMQEAQKEVGLIK